MKIENIVYHTRLYATGEKVVGGSFSGSLDFDTVNRLVNSHFNVIIKTSGNPTFVDKDLREVNLYFNILPNMSEKGKTAIAKYNYDIRLREDKRKEKEDNRKEKIENLINNMSDDELLDRLQSKSYY